MKKILLIVMSMIIGTATIAQTTISGAVIDGNSNEPLPGVNLKIRGTSTGTSTDFDGLFKIETSQSLPLTLEVTFVGYDTKTLEITESVENLSVSIFENQTYLAACNSAFKMKLNHEYCYSQAYTQMICMYTMTKFC